MVYEKCWVSKTRVTLTNAFFYNIYILSFTKSLHYFGIFISPSLGSAHQYFFKTYTNKIGHNKHTYVVASVQVLATVMYVNII
jgi:hypothetical protein